MNFSLIIRRIHAIQAIDKRNDCLKSIEIHFYLREVLIQTIDPKNRPKDK